MKTKPDDDICSYLRQDGFRIVETVYSLIKKKMYDVFFETFRKIRIRTKTNGLVTAVS